MTEASAVLDEQASREPAGTSEPEPVVQLDGPRLLGALEGASSWLDAHMHGVNALNVFPVPDGDTGTNMSLTMRAALDEVKDRASVSLSELAHTVAQGALMGARGNSGVILSQILRGFSRGVDGRDTLTPQDLARGLKEGAVTAYNGVMKPVEGTILTVARESAEVAAKLATAGSDLLGVLTGTVAEARASLARTPSLLPVLAEAGVVDAGGQGLLLIFEGMLRHLRGEATEGDAVIDLDVAQVHAIEGATYAYDTQFVILGSGLDPEAIRGGIASLGDSVLVVGDGEAVKVHVHTDSPGKALDLGIAEGQVTSVIIENMQLQFEEFRAATDRASLVKAGSLAEETAAPAALGETGVVAVVAGEGLRRVFESLGVSAIVSGGQTMNPSTQDLLEAIQNVPAERVIVLPNNTNIVLAAQQATALCKKEAAVVPSKTIPQGISALLAYNFGADLAANCELMTEACQQVETVEVTCAVRSAQVNGMGIVEGQYLGLLNGDLVSAGEDSRSVVRDVLERIEAEQYEILTLYYGVDTSGEDAAALAEDIRRDYVALEVEVLDGGQAHYHYVVSAE